jgi:membrane protease YdiL (CAAX protease family)
VSHAPPARRDLGGLWLLVTFGFGWIGVLALVVAVVVVAVAVAWAQQFGGDPDALGKIVAQLNAGDMSGLPAWVMSLTLAVQFPGMLALVFVVHALVGWFWYAPRPGLVARPDGWTGVFALRATTWESFAAAAVIGLTVGMLPGWIAEQIRSLNPDAQGAVEMIHDTLTKGPLLSRLVAIVAVVGVGPLVEELVFRGFMWDALRRVGSPRLALVGSSLLFALYHMDPAQSSALLLTAFTLGWVRWVSGSVWPGVVIHVINNGLGVIAAYVAIDGSAPVSFATAGVSLIACAALGLRRLRVDGSLASDLPPGVG